MPTILILCAILAVASGQANDISTLSSDSNLATRTDDYINLNRQQYAKNIQYYDAKVQDFRDHYAQRVDAVYVQLEMVTSSIIQIEERLNPLMLLSDFSKQCVVRYRSPIPTVASTKASITSCAVQATSQVNSLISSPQNTRNSLQNYYTNYFEKEITNCAKNYNNQTLNYTTCVTSITSNTNTYTITNQKTFDVQMDAAECSAKAYIKRALDCSYTVQSRTLMSVAEANVSINNCLLGKDECKPCEEGFTCRESYTFQPDYRNQTMLNPFYGRENGTNCIMLRALKSSVAA